MKEEKLSPKSSLLPIIVLILILALWALVSVLHLFPESVFPSPPAVFRGFGEEIRAGRLFDDLVAASRNARWLAIVPIVAFCLITMAPGFRRSAQRLLPHGHLKWRAGEYLRDVNSALAGYVRAQLAAGLIVGAACSVGFTLLGLPYAVPMGAAAGVLELVPAIGPVTVLLIALMVMQAIAIL